MHSASTTTFALLGMLATRSYTGYELTQQIRRSLRFVWPVSEGHLYREQRRLVDWGWATADAEPAGRRTRKRYAITELGRDALAEWLTTPPGEPALQVEGVLRAFYANHGSQVDLATAMQASADAARAMLAEMVGFAEEYLASGGPLEMLEGAQELGSFRGRPMHPERLPSVALSIDVTTRLLAGLADFFEEVAGEVTTWPTMTSAAATPGTRARLEAVVARHAPPDGAHCPKASS